MVIKVVLIIPIALELSFQSKTKKLLELEKMLGKLILLLFFFTASSRGETINQIRCEIQKCSNCGPSPSELEKQIICQGSSSFSIFNNDTITQPVEFNNYQTKFDDKVVKVILRKIYVNDHFHLNLSLINHDISHVLIENCIVKQPDTQLMNSMKHLAILDSRIINLRLSELYKLNYIYIRGVQLERLELSFLGNLKHLTMKDLVLKEIDTIEKLDKAMTSLTLDDTGLLFNDDPYFIGKRVSLYRIVNSNSNLFFFKGMFNLKSLKIKNNRFLNNTIGVEIFKRLGALKTLDLTANEIGFLTVSCFSDLKNLEKLILNYNKLKVFSWEPFNGLNLLSELSVRNNSIDKIVIMEKRNSTSLKKIDMSFNLLTKIEKLTFYDHHQLEELDLKHNLINQFEQNSFDNLKNLTYLNFDRQMNGQMQQISFFRADCTVEQTTTV